jgi:hypothetical protein
MAYLQDRGLQIPPTGPIDMEMWSKSRLSYYLGVSLSTIGEWRKAPDALPTGALISLRLVANLARDGILIPEMPGSYQS